MTVDDRGRPIKRESKSDSLQHRDAFADSILSIIAISILLVIGL